MEMIPRLIGIVSCLAKQCYAHSHEHTPQSAIVSLSLKHLETKVFHYGPRYNALLATLVIQLLPGILILSVGSFREADSLLLSLLVPFALGTLLGDIFLHLLPEAFVKCHDALQIVECGTAVFLGFMGFFLLDKIIRICTLRQPHIGHSHSHNTTAVSQPKESNINVSAYLNIISSFAHNIMDGIALATSFYTSTHVGVTTTIAIIFHEVPHELGDFAIMLSNGFNFQRALQSQLLTSLGALAGTAVGCLLNEINTTKNNFAHVSFTSDRMLPITAGGFIYITAINVLPDLLRIDGTSRAQEFQKAVVQVGSASVGFYLMVTIA